MATYSDDFNRASLGANWTQDSGAWSINSSIVLNQMTSGASYRKLRWSGGAMASTNVASQVAGESPGTTQAFGAYVRGSGSATVTYYGIVGFGGDFFYLVEITAGAETVLATGSACTAATNYTVRVEAEGSAIRGYVNGSLDMSTTDSSLTGNDVGCMSFGSLSNTTTEYIDDWTAYDLAAATSMPIPARRTPLAILAR